VTFKSIGIEDWISGTLQVVSVTRCHEWKSTSRVVVLIGTDCKDNNYENPTNLQS